MTSRDDLVEGLRAGAALLEPAGRELVVATGADRVRFLQGIVTGNVADTPVGAGCHAALLTAKAHIVAEMRIFVRDESLYLVVPAGRGGETAAALARYAIMDDFAAAPRPGWDVVALLGVSAPSCLAAVGYPPGTLASQPTWSHSDVAGPEGPLWLARVRQLGVDGYWIAGPSAELGHVAAALASTGGADRLALDVAEAARIAAGEPAWGREITPDYFPMEVGLEDTIDYTKGCFLGQEPIVRIRDRGHVNWRLVRLTIAAGASPSAEPRPGDRLESDLKAKAGKLTSVARLPDGRGVVGLGLLHVSVPAGQSVRIVSSDGGAHVVTATATVID